VEITSSDLAMIGSTPATRVEPEEPSSGTVRQDGEQRSAEGLELRGTDHGGPVVSELFACEL
jgi:hypothetical protein